MSAAPQARSGISKPSQLEKENTMLKTAIDMQQYKIQDLETSNKTNLVVAGIFGVAGIAAAYYIGANPAALATGYTFVTGIPGIVTNFVSEYFGKKNP
jgi:1-deoxy-D-xylulose 5-phosphate reductoisomerase